MLKFLRKYNTLILVLGGSLLMVVFLVPQAIEQIGQNPSNVSYAKVGDHTLSQQDFLEYQQSWTLVNQIAGAAVVVMQIENVDHWILLNIEAEKYDLIGGAADGAASIPFFARYIAQADLAIFMEQNPNAIQSRAQYDQEMDHRAEQFRLNIIQNLEAQTMTGRTETQYYRAMARLRGIGRLLQTYDALTGLSIPETRIAAVELFDRVTTDLAIVPASAFRPDPQSLDQDALQAHFEQYQSTLPGEGEFGFGYLLPDAVRFEYLRIHSDALTGSFTTSSADLLEYFRKNQNRYFGQDFKQAENRVRTDFINARVNERLEAITTAIQRERLRAVQSLPVDSAAERYRVVPEGWVGPELDVYAQVAREAAQLSGQAAEDLVSIEPVSEEFLSRADLRQSDLSRAQFRFTASEVFLFPNLLLLAKEFGGDERLDLQRGLLFGPLEVSESAGTRDLVFVRITETRRQGAPDSLDAVEEQVREDLATLRGYERLIEQSETFKSAFADGSYVWFNDMDFSNLDAAEQHPDTVLGFRVAQTELGTNLPLIAFSPVPEAVLDLARTLDPTQPIEQVSVDERTAAVPMPDSLSLALATIKSFRPVTVDRMSEGMVQIEQRLGQEALSRIVESPYTFDSLAQRMGFQRLDRDEEDEI